MRCQRCQGCMISDHFMDLLNVSGENRFQRVALSELWRHHRPRYCAPSPVGSEPSCEIEAALVGSHSHAFMHFGS
jgi:hypothetical protein